MHMTNEEMFIADAEYWLGEISEGELVRLIGEGGIAKIAYIYTEYRENRNANDEYETAGIEGITPFEHYSWFSLLIAEAEKSPEDVANWPFPVVHGSIPE